MFTPIDSLGGKKYDDFGGYTNFIFGTDMNACSYSFNLGNKFKIKNYMILVFKSDYCGYFNNLIFDIFIISMFMGIKFSRLKKICHGILFFGYIDYIL